MNLPERNQHKTKLLNKSGISDTDFVPNRIHKNNTSIKSTVKNEANICIPKSAANISAELDEELSLLKAELLRAKKELAIKEGEIEALKVKLGDVKSSMDQFSYVASHDLKEPLRMVTSYLGLLKNKFGSQLDDKANTYIDFAIDGGSRLHTMFNGLLDLSQIGRVEEPRVTKSFTEIIEEVKININKKIKESGAQIIISGALPKIEVLERSSIKLLENLICNAIKFSKPDELPVIEISARENKTNWEFCVADNGIGMEEKNYKQIFAVFSKVHNSLLYPGNGIGLAICKKAVEQHKGDIWVTSIPNVGSKFYFTLQK